MDVQGLLKRKYSTHTQIEQRISHCQNILGISKASVADFDVSPSSSEQLVGSEGSIPKGASGTALERRTQLRQESMAHIELQMLVRFRKKFLSDEELRELIEHKNRQMDSLPVRPEFCVQREAINSELVELEKKLQREHYAKVPQEIQVTREALCQRFRSKTPMLPINDVSEQYLRLCTNNFALENRLGKGGFGSVFHVYDAVMCLQYAVKTTDKYTDPSLGREVQVSRRGYLCRFLHHFVSYLCYLFARFFLGFHTLISFVCLAFIFRLELCPLNVWYSNTPVAALFQIVSHLKRTDSNLLGHVDCVRPLVWLRLSTICTTALTIPSPTTTSNLKTLCLTIPWIGLC
jgi:hypothetical protein